QQYAVLKQELLKNEGLITYSDAYRYAFEAVGKRPDLQGLLSKRFRFVFIDEFQDCSIEQRDILDKVFDTAACTIMRIGDTDQAIYNSDSEKTVDWVPESNALTIASSNRYSQEIADTLTPLRSGKVQITSLRGSSGILPTIIIFDDDSRKKVIDAFIALLEKHQITDPNGVYKVIGWVKSESSKGLKIGDYWDGYHADIGGLAETKYWSMIDTICDELRNGKTYKVESTLRKLLVRVLKYHNCKDDDGSAFTYSSVKKRLDEKYFDDYRGTILRLAGLCDYSRDAVDPVIKIAINTMLGSTENSVDAFKRLPSHFMEDGVLACTHSENGNIISDPIRGRRLQVSTIHKVKGETHDATLYLETVNNKKSDLERVIPHYKGTKVGTAQIDQYSRKCVYVGFSRPRKLLCVAMRASTYEAAWKNFSGWEVHDCRGNS
ncbi:MAG: UvrD-helicase domain-containing protein, partial [Clostridia bacterium]